MKSLLLLFYIHVLYRVAELWKCSFTFLQDSLLCTKTNSLIIFVLIFTTHQIENKHWKNLIKNLLRWKGSITSKSTFGSLIKTLEPIFNNLLVSKIPSIFMFLKKKMAADVMWSVTRCVMKVGHWQLSYSPVSRFGTVGLGTEWNKQIHH